MGEELTRCPDCGAQFDSDGLLMVHFMKAHITSGPTRPQLFPAAKTTPAAPFTYTFLDLGGPVLPGMEWDVMRYMIWGNDPFAAVAGSVVVFIGSVAPPDSNAEPTFPNMVDLAVGLPAVGSWSARQLILSYGEHLIAAMKGLPASTQLAASVQASQYRRRDFRPAG